MPLALTWDMIPHYFRLKGVSGKYFSYFPTKTCCGYSLEAPQKRICFYGEKKRREQFLLKNSALSGAMIPVHCHDLSSGRTII